MLLSSGTEDMVKGEELVVGDDTYCVAHDLQTIIVVDISETWLCPILLRQRSYSKSYSDIKTSIPGEWVTPCLSRCNIGCVCTLTHLDGGGVLSSCCCCCCVRSNNGSGPTISTHGILLVVRWYEVIQ